MITITTIRFQIRRGCCFPIRRGLHTHTCTQTHTHTHTRTRTHTHTHTHSYQQPTHTHFCSLCVFWQTPDFSSFLRRLCQLQLNLIRFGKSKIVFQVSPTAPNTPFQMQGRCGIHLVCRCSRKARKLTHYEQESAPSPQAVKHRTFPVSCAGGLAGHSQIRLEYFAPGHHLPSAE